MQQDNEPPVRHMKHELVWGRSESRPGSINLKVFGQRLSPHVQSGTSSEVNDRRSRKKKGILNVIDHIIKIQCATASLVPSVTNDQRLPDQWSKARILAVNSHNVHDATCDH